MVEQHLQPLSVSANPTVAHPHRSTINHNRTPFLHQAYGQRSSTFVAPMSTSPSKRQRLTGSFSPASSRQDRRADKAAGRSTQHSHIASVHVFDIATQWSTVFHCDCPVRDYAAIIHHVVAGFTTAQHESCIPYARK